MLPVRQFRELFSDLVVDIRSIGCRVSSCRTSQNTTGIGSEPDTLIAEYYLLFCAVILFEQKSGLCRVADNDDHLFGLFIWLYMC